ncbi:hypothetical protein PV11_01592 [Exophiala sideris]|uniref:Exonuclease domain-containing protein n=1 Tax=Exophiala sideris TaxID=1016849 RepID=A0A0D1YWN7_9EURO|nr:hypothetical protein PV11_01592 [Exophiala sideris]
MGDTTETNIAWSYVGETPVAIEKLRLLCHSRAELTKGGYVVEPLSVPQIEAKIRCFKCRARVRKRPEPESHAGPDMSQKDMSAGQEQRERNNSMTMSKGKELDTANKANTPPKCVYHPRKFKSRNQKFRCCDRHASQPGCVQAQEHTLPAYLDPELLKCWQYHPTPDYPEAENCVGRPVIRRWQDAAAQEPRRPVSAIALDCEMGISVTGESELIRLTAVDFFKGVVLIDRFVYPSMDMISWNTQWSGVTARDMRAAMKKGTCIFGRDIARELLWKHVAPETIVIVHGGQNDLTALRWLHSRIIDSHILESYTNVKTEGGRSLQNLCKLKLGITIRQDGVRGGHDSLEDAMACRELVIDWMRKIPGIGIIG